MTPTGMTPHGPGFQFIDRFEKTSAKSGSGWKHLEESAPFFADHFPGNPIMPGVLLVECAAQTAGVLIMHDSQTPRVPLFLAAIEQFRILGPVFPGETLQTRVTLEKELGHLFLVEVESHVLDRPVARGRLMLSRQLAELP